MGGNGSAMGDGRAQHDDSTTWSTRPAVSHSNEPLGRCGAEETAMAPIVEGIVVARVVHRGSSASWHGFPQI